MRRTNRIASVLMTCALTMATGGGLTFAASEEAATSMTLCGASFTGERPGETYQQALTRLDGYYGGLQSVRIFYGGLPDPWPGKLNVDGRPIVVSFKAQPRNVIAGVHDQYMRWWFANAPRESDTYWTFFHEPEDNIARGEFTALDFRAAWEHLAGLAAEADNPRLYGTLILMQWTLDPRSGRDWHDYFPGSDVIDVFGWDSYNTVQPNTTSYRSPESMFDDLIAVSRSVGLPWGIAETGSGLVPGDDGTRRAEWLRSVTSYAAARGALFIQYFDHDWREHGGPDFRLRDEAGMAVWREFCAG